MPLPIHGVFNWSTKGSLKGEHFKGSLKESFPLKTLSKQVLFRALCVQLLNHTTPPVQLWLSTTFHSLLKRYRISQAPLMQGVFSSESFISCETFTYAGTLLKMFIFCSKGPATDIWMDGVMCYLAGAFFTHPEPLAHLVTTETRGRELKIRKGGRFNLVLLRSAFEAPFVTAKVHCTLPMHAALCCCLFLAWILEMQIAFYL